MIFWRKWLSFSHKHSLNIFLNWLPPGLGSFQITIDIRVDVVRCCCSLLLFVVVVRCCCCFFSFLITIMPCFVQCSRVQQQRISANVSFIINKWVSQLQLITITNHTTTMNSDLHPQSIDCAHWRDSKRTLVKISLYLSNNTCLNSFFSPFCCLYFVCFFVVFCSCNWHAGSICVIFTLIVFIFFRSCHQCSWLWFLVTSKLELLIKSWLFIVITLSTHSSIHSSLACLKSQQPTPHAPHRHILNDHLIECCVKVHEWKIKTKQNKIEKLCMWSKMNEWIEWTKQ